MVIPLKAKIYNGSKYGLTQIENLSKSDALCAKYMQNESFDVVFATPVSTK